MTAKKIWLWVALVGALLSVALLSPRTPQVGATTRWANAVSQSNVSTEQGQTYPLALGAGNTRVGEVIIHHDSTHLYVEFKTEAGYSLGAAHVCASVAAFGWTSPGRCPYTQSLLPTGTTQYTFAIPFAQINAGCGARVSLQAHASIIGAASESLGGAYAGAFKGQVTYAVKIYTAEPDVQGGIEMLSRSLALDSKAFFVALELGNQYLKIGNREEALRAYRMAQENAPPSNDIGELLARQIERVQSSPLAQIQLLRNPGLE